MIPDKFRKTIDAYVDGTLLFLMTCFLAMPVLNYAYVQATQQMMDQSVFIYGFFILSSICVPLVLYKFFAATMDNWNLGFLGIVKVILTRNLMYVLFIIYILWIFLSVAYHGFTDWGVWGLSFKREGLVTFWLYTFVFFSGSFIEKESHKTFLMYVFALCAIVLAVLNVMVNLSANPDVMEQHLLIDRLRGPFNNNNHHGYYLAMTGTTMLALLVFVNNIKWRITFFAGFCLTITAIFYADTLGALFSLVLGGIMVFIIFAVMNFVKNREKADKEEAGNEKAAKSSGGIKVIIISAVGIVVMIFGFYFISLGESVMAKQVAVFIDQLKSISSGQTSGEFGTYRVQLWELTIDYIKEKPVFGWDSDGIWDKLEKATYMEEYGTAMAQRTHNEYLQQTAFYGIVAGVSYTLGCIAVFLRALRNRRNLRVCDAVFLSAAFAYIVGAFFGVTMVQVYPMFMAVLGLAVTNNRKIHKL